MRLIDADAFERRVMFDADIEDLQDVIYALRDYESIADAVQVVRCKDCIHNYVTTWNHGKRDKPQCHFTDLVRSNEFFCGFGERRSE